MKNKFLILLLLMLVAAFVAEANPVDIRTAREVASKFMNANTKTPLRGLDEMQWVTTYNTSRGEAAFYIFSTSDGFVIVSAEDSATPILGYSDEGRFDENDIPVQLQDYLQDFVEQIQYSIENHLEPDETTVRRWELVQTIGRLMEQRATTVVEPLITSKWGQGCYYNNRCPIDYDGSCGHVKVGCVATSFAQILHYWGYPSIGTGSYSYTPSGYPTQSVNFGATTYDWTHMPNWLTDVSTTTQINAVATLMWHCGVAVNMNYGPYASGASTIYLAPAFVNYFDYSEDLSRVFRSDYGDEEWMTMMKDCLDLGRPIHYVGSGNSEGHAFVCDGYDPNDMLHFNWGWNGNCDGYYALGALNPAYYAFNSGNEAIVNIHPKCLSGTTYEVTASVNPSGDGLIYGTGYYDCNTVCTMTAVPDDGYVFCSWTENGEMVSSEPTYSFNVVDDRSLVANFSEEGSVCNIVFDLYDTYEWFGWYGNYLAVDYGNGITEQFTLDNVTSASFSRAVTTGSVVTLNWIPVSYMNNCSFDVSYDNGYPICHGENLASGFQYEFTVDCDAAFAPRVISVIADPQMGGAVSGGGMFEVGEFCTVVATPSEGYYFANWTENGVVVATDPTYSFVVMDGRNLTAHFVIDENIVFADDNVKALCVQNWDTNGDGELSYYEASMVTSLGDVFTFNMEITSFEELQYFIGLSMIDDNAFTGCSNLTGSLILPNSISRIGYGAFDGCSGLTGSLIFPISVTLIDDAAFWDCSGFTGSLTIPTALTSIGDYTFSGCSGFTGPLTIPNSVTSIGCSAFSSCSGLSSLTIPNTVTSIGDWAFSWCSGFTGSLAIPNSVDTIGAYAFYGCGGHMDQLIIGGSVTSIGDCAFLYCNGLRSVVVLPMQPPTIGTDVFAEDIPIYVLCKSEEAYHMATEWHTYPNIMGMCSSWTISVVADPVDGGRVSGAGLYGGSNYCVVIAEPNEGYHFVNWTENGSVVSYDPNYSFIVTGERVLKAHFAMEGNIVFADANVKARCVAHWDTNGDGELSYVEAAMVTDLGTVFMNGSNLTSFDELQYFTGLTSIEGFAFNGCYGLTSIILPNSVTFIGSHAFYNCGHLTSMTIPNSVTSIAGNPFVYCSRLVRINVEAGNMVYDSRNNCNAIIKTGTNELIAGCKNSFIPDSVTSIGDYAFSNCSTLASITIPNSVVSIGERAFFMCYLPSLTIPSSVTSIGKEAFGNCIRLASITVLAERPPSLGIMAFYGVNHSVPVYVPCGSLEDYQNAGGWNEFTNCSEMCPGTISVVASPVEGGTVMGGGYYEGGAICSLTAMANMGYIFVSWMKDGEVVSNDETFSFVVTGDASIVAHFEQIHTQAIILTAGVNWVSFNVEITLDDLKTALVETLPEATSIMIKSKEAYTTYNGTSWRGQLNTMDVAQMYMIIINSDCEIMLEGIQVDPAEHPVTITNGSNWIGFPLSESMTVADAFAEFEAVSGDMIKSKGAYTIYNGTRWRGALTTLVPGQGYVFNSVASGERTLVFPTSAK